MTVAPEDLEVEVLGGKKKGKPKPPLPLTETGGGRGDDCRVVD